MNLTTLQKLTILVGVLSVLAAASTQFDSMFAVWVHDPKQAGALTKALTAFFSLAAAMLAVPVTILTSLTNQVKTVQAIPGVDAITVNKQAGPALALLAVDPAQDKIAPADGAQKAVENIANAKQ